MKAKPLYSTLFLLLIAWTTHAGENQLVEKRRTVIKTFTVGRNDRLTVDNQYGQVKINLWEKTEIRVQVAITANAPTDQRAEDYLRAVNIEEKREGNIISLLTEIDRSQFGKSNWNAWRSSPGEKNSIQIDYTINMPKYNPLIVRNKFGNTDIPSFRAPLQVYSRNGHFSADDLENNDNNIEVLYGTAKIGNMDGGKMEIKYSNLDLARVRSLVLDYKGGKLKIGEVKNLEADIDYSEYTAIGNVQESCKVNLSYSGNFRVGRLPASAGNVNIQASYSSVVLPAESNQFDVTVTNGSFHLPDDAKVIYTNQPAKTNTFRETKQYSGTVGSGHGTVIKVVSHYGDVRLKD
ncbi:hypothetical protein [Persicitalea jodogahamensis]|uniref:Adhesin domain-containing protein n=1 Tax=Persicitalea jodogahamensis TaxID=402147 RepID=A0A8J3DCN2_9BACT|nr:hypothetical protein [Persicitalea jodogahamensis]GHB84165.1 hypothetical protein GCM10007390_44210 [Persicitalea jodogahamensis]